MSGYDLAVAYRVYPGVSRTPAIFSDDKLKLVELGVRSFREALGSLRPRIWVLLDGCPAEYRALFEAYFPPDQLEIVQLAGEGNLATFERQIDLLLAQDVSETVCFAEDDYFYLRGGLERCVDFLRAHADADFVTPYDHPDYYAEASHGHPNRVRAYGDRHWRTANSTCLTFLTTRRQLRRAQHTFRSYARGNHDSSLWLALTKHLVRDPSAFLRFLRLRHFGWKIVLRAWYHRPLEILLGRRYSLWAPVPSVATHLEATRLAPVVDWTAAMEPMVAEIRAASQGGRPVEVRA